MTARIMVLLRDHMITITFSMKIRIVREEIGTDEDKLSTLKELLAMEEE